MSSVPSVSPVVLVILDGWGYRQDSAGNAVHNAQTPIMKALWEVYPHTLIQASGRAVGLPPEQMGNSEVGHLNLGAGRVVPQELVRITEAFENKTALKNSVLVHTCQRVKRNSGKLHLVGLCSEGGVHSHLDHLYGLLELAQQQDIREVCIHLITDGRDTAPTAALEQLKPLVEKLQNNPIAHIATVSGRYYAMDRDKRWDRTEKMYRVMTEDGVGNGLSLSETLQQNYASGMTDEFVLPVRLAPGAVVAGDGVIFFNFRPDRTRQLTRAFVMPNFVEFTRTLIKPLIFTTLTQYEEGLPVQVAFTPINLDHLLGEVIAEHGLKQFRCAETEKYAHVTYFFNGGVEKAYPGEDRVMVASPRVATYDEAPAMSAAAVTDAVITALNKREYSLVIINFANPDMVGHTGNYEAARQAIAVVDTCVGKVLEAVAVVGGTALITADHGNAEVMWDAQGNPWTAHTTNPVPFIVVEGEGLKIAGRGGDLYLRADGCLADVAPTILEILGLPQPAEMTGVSLLQPTDYELHPQPAPQFANF